MTKIIFAIAFSLLATSSFSQITFEKGYFINNSNVKTECLIKNTDWKNNPTQFNFKITSESEIQQESIENVQEFGIYDISKHIRIEVDLDRSSERIKDLSKTSNPLFEKETLFLNVLIEGKASLYEYRETGLRRYFFATENKEIKPLIYKKYEGVDGNMGENTRFKQQLWNNVKCKNFKVDKLERLEYTKSSLVNYFTDYNNCENTSFSVYSDKSGRKFLNLNLRPRLNNSSLYLENLSTNFGDIEMDSQFSFALGLEAEYILPFNKNKWAVLIEPTYRTYTAEETIESDNIVGGTLSAEADYSSIEIPLGLRHYFYINPNSKIFVNVSYIFDLAINSEVEFTRNDGTNFYTIELEQRNNLGVGVGFMQNDRYSLEIRYHLDRRSFGNDYYWDSTYKNISLILGYRLF